MPFRTFAAIAPLALGLAACSSADEVSGEPAVQETDAAGSTATAQAAAGKAKAVEEETDLYSFAYAYPAAVGALPELAAQFDKDVEDSKAKLIAESEDDKASAAENDYPYRPHSFEREWKVVANLPQYLSLTGDFSTYTGGAHGMYGRESLIWDKQADAGVAGIEMFRSAAALDSALGDKLCDALNAERGKRRGEPVTPATDDPTGFESCQPVENATVIVGSSNGQAFDRIGIWYGPYVAGPYAEGSFELNFPVDAAIVEAVKPEYREAFAARR
ncbi:DUF4163 domain-containing protein [Pelagerythrobacter sp.]|uniref:DUF4163 domain-containing protein n=1 Tax=Pelagerythrobacter sp. TaxID=2800702 RepID=UPI0035B12D7A